VKTERLIDLLARDAGPAPRALVLRRLGPAALLGLLASAAVALGWLGSVPAEMYRTPAPWMKLGYGAALALAAGWLAARLGRPAAPLAGPQRATAAVLAAMAAVGAVVLLLAPDAARLQALLGHSWARCPWNVALLSLPALAAALWALRGLAPTRPRAAGLAAGLMAGALGALGYALSCEESSPAFVAVWYTAGVALVGLLGAALGPRVLRW
jgi:hypothetical protein